MDEFIECLIYIQLNHNADTIKWCLTSNGQFSVAYLY
jgi:hypothetical protein